MPAKSSEFIFKSKLLVIVITYHIVDICKYTGNSQRRQKISAKCSAPLFSTNCQRNCQPPSIGFCQPIVRRIALAEKFAVEIAQ